MKIKRYEANTIESALYQIRQELGPDALILHTQKIRKKGLLGLLKRDAFEVTAAIDVNTIDNKQGAQQTNKAELPVKNNGGGAAKISGDLGVLKEQLSDVNVLVTNLKKQLLTPLLKTMSPQYIDAFNKLINSQVEPELAEEIIATIHKAAQEEVLHNDKEIKEFIVSSLASKIKSSGPIKVKDSRKVIALIGATGVGKTTTLAKLAAHFALIEKKKIALITADTYRIAAVDQLHTYSNIIGIPLEVVVTPQECRMALANHSDKEIILVDTAGRSPSNETQLKELRDLLDSIKPHEAHLVLSASSGYQETLNAIETFDNEFLSKLIISKVDEALSLGQFINIANKKQLPFSYITNGQNVPQDFEVFNSKQFAKRILEGEK